MKSKWRKHQIFMKDMILRMHLPETTLFSRSQFLRMLSVHRMVYVKPTDSSLGYGIIRASAIKSYDRPKYRLQFGTTVRIFYSLSTLYTAVTNAMKHRPYLIQQGIQMMRKQSRMFDVRIMVQHVQTGQKTQAEWKVTGIAARLAGRGKIITNISGGGQVVAWNETLVDDVDKKRFVTITAQMKQLAVQAAQQLHQHWPTLTEAGVDIAIDQKRRIWILEVNSRPDIKMFSHLSDQRMLQNMVQVRRSLTTSQS